VLGWIPDADAVNWFYAINDQRHGPVSDGQLDTLFQRGVINLETLVWSKGMADWQTLDQARQQSRIHLAGPPETSPTTIPCAVCQGYFPSDEIIRLEAFWVCAQCKPQFLQRMLEGATLVTRQVWRHRRQVVAHTGTTFPDRCIRCNAPTGGRQIKCELHWSPPFRLETSTRRAVVHIAMCARHRAERGRIVVGCCLAIVLGVSSFFFASPWFYFVGLTLVASGFVIGGMTGRFVTAIKIENDFVFVKGAGKPFLDSLPEWTSRA